MSEWISVEDRLPELETLVLVHGRGYYNRAMHVFADLRRDFGHVKQFVYASDVTHWMPLPEPPQSS